MAHDVFISYSTKNKGIADAVCARMESGGIRCWYAPRDIKPGTDWAESIIEAIDTSKAMVLLFTDASNISPQVLREINYAVGAGVTVIPMRLTKTEPIEKMRYYLSAVHWIDAVDADLNKKIEELYTVTLAVIDTKPVDVVPTSSKPVNKKTGIRIGIAAAAVAVAAGALVFKNRPAAPESGTESNVSMEESEEDKTGEWEKTPENTVAELNGDPDSPIGSLSVNAGRDLSRISEGNAMSTLTAGGYFAYDDGWYYYSDPNNRKLYKMREDGSERQALADFYPEFISVYDDHIYFVGFGDLYGIIRTDLDGQNRNVLLGSDVDFMFIREKTLYFRQYDLMYALNLDLVGEDYDLDEKEKLIGTFDEDNWPMTSCFDEDCIYYPGLENSYLYRAPYDGAKPELLLDHSISSLTIGANTLYFYDNDEKATASYDLATGKETLLTKDELSSMNITGDGIYAVNSEKKLVLFDPSTGEQTVLSDREGITDVCVAGNKIYCDSSEGLFVVDKDGSNPIEL